jgi:hypothetical protein
MQVNERRSRANDRHLIAVDLAIQVTRNAKIPLSSVGNIRVFPFPGVESCSFVATARASEFFVRETFPCSRETDACRYQRVVEKSGKHPKNMPEKISREMFSL